MAEPGDMNLGLETIKGLAGKMAQAATGFAGVVVFARVLGPTSFGGFYFLLTLVFVADRPMRGAAQALRKRYSETDADKRELFGTVLLVDLALWAVAAVGVWLFGEQLTTQTNVPNAPLVFFELILAVSLFFPVQQMLAAEGWVSKQTWNDTLRSLLTLPLQLGFVLLGFGAAGMGYGLAGATVLVVPVALYFTRVRPTLPSRETLRSMWEYARYSVPIAVLGKTYSQLDILLLGALVTTGAVGNYKIAFQLTVPASFLYGVVASGFMPKISNRHSKGRPINEDVSNAVSFVSLLSVPIFFGALALPEALVVTLFGEQYASAELFLVGLALYQVSRSQAVVQRKTLNGIDRPDIGLRVDAAALALNVVLGVWLVLTHGPVGVVVATVIAETVRYAGAAYYVSRLVDGVTFLPRTLFEQVVAGVAMFAVVELVSTYVGITSWVWLSLVVAVGAAVYGLVLVTISPQVRTTTRAVYQDAAN